MPSSDEIANREILARCGEDKQFWGCVEDALDYAYKARNPRKHMRRLALELKRLPSPYPHYQNPTTVADLIARGWTQRLGRRRPEGIQ